MMETPLLATEINGAPFRVFSSPHYRKTGKPDLPWHSVDDLRKILGMPDELVAMFQRKMRNDWDDLVTVATPDGITTVGPHYMAEGMIGMFSHRPRLLKTELRKRIRGRVRSSVTEAIGAMVPHLDPISRLVFALEGQERQMMGVAAL